MSYANELAELQATIARLTAENERLQEAHEQVCTNYNKVSYACEERGKEIERLKGGQGEPVDAILLENCEEVTVQDYGRGYFATDDCVTQLYTSQPAPVSSELVQLLERAKVYARGPFLDEINACLEKQREPVSVVMTDEQILETMRPAIYRADGGYIFDTAKDDVIAAGRSLIDKVKELNT